MKKTTYIFSIGALLRTILLLVPMFLQSYLIIWDLGDTLVYVSKLGMVSHIGLADCICYHLFHNQDPNKLQNLLFDVLEECGGKQTGDPEEMSYHTQHRPLPQILCDWLSGALIDQHQLIKTINKKLKQLKKQNYFKNDLEYKIVKKAIESMFRPEVLIECTHVCKEALKIVEEIGRRGIHQQTILSNWDGMSFNTFKASPAGKELSRFFDMDALFISSHLKCLKPHPDIFNYIFERYQTTPEQCLFIDDQFENVRSAQKINVNAIQVKNHDFKQLRKDLITFGIL